MKPQYTNESTGVFMMEVLEEVATCAGFEPGPPRNEVAKCYDGVLTAKRQARWMATRTGIEPVVFAVTGQRLNHSTNGPYHPLLVRSGRLELPSLSAHAPQACAYTNSATIASTDFRCTNLGNASQ